MRIKWHCDFASTHLKSLLPNSVHFMIYIARMLVAMSDTLYVERDQTLQPTRWGIPITFGLIK